MARVILTGQLVCADDDELAVVRRHLPLHTELTRAEEGCVRFDVRQTDDPLIWQVDEIFVDQAAFDAHQNRAAASSWGSATAGIERRYSMVSQAE